jgi:hypothetical protein
MNPNQQASPLKLGEDRNHRPFVNVPSHQVNRVHQVLVDNAIGHTIDPLIDLKDGRRVIHVGVLWDRQVIQDLLDGLGSR